MSDTPFLDLDAVTPAAKKVVKIAGVEHEYHEPTVGSFLQESQAFEKLNKQHEGSDTGVPIEELMKVVIAQVKTAFPTISDAEFEGLTMQQIRALREFVLADVNLDDETAEAGN